MPTPTSQLPLSLGNIKHLDLGRVHAAFDEELKRVTQDCMDRPADKNPRTVSLVVRIKPIPDTHGNNIVCDETEVECEVCSAVPKRRSKLYTMKPKHDGSLAFQPESPEEPDQEGLPYPERNQDRKQD